MLAIGRAPITPTEGQQGWLAPGAHLTTYIMGITFRRQPLRCCGKA